MKKLPASFRRLLQTEIDPAFSKRTELILHEVLTKKPKTILDAGCGRGFHLKTLSSIPFIKKLHGVDLNKEYIGRAKKIVKNKKVIFQQASLYNLPYKDNSFDFVLCSEVLEHLKNDHQAVKELYRVLKKGKTLMVTVPNLNFPFLWDPLNWLLMRTFKTHINKNIWWLAGIFADHERLYTQKSLILLLQKHGFKVKKTQKIIRYCLPFSHFLLYGLGKNLVERFGVDGFDRFSAKKRPLSKLFSLIFRLPSLLDPKDMTGKPSVGIVITAIKK